MLPGQCQRTRVSGLTTTSTVRQSTSRLTVAIDNRVESSARRGLTFRSWKSANCFCRNRFSAANVARGVAPTAAVHRSPTRRLLKSTTRFRDKDCGAQGIYPGPPRLFTKPIAQVSVKDRPDVNSEELGHRCSVAYAALRAGEERHSQPPPTTIASSFLPAFPDIVRLNLRFARNPFPRCRVPSDRGRNSYRGR